MFYEFKSTDGDFSESGLLDHIKAEAEAFIKSDRSGQGTDNRTDNVLICIKLCIERMLSELTKVYRKPAEEIIKLLTLFKEKNIPEELLVACAECYEKDPNQVNVVRSCYAHSFFRLKKPSHFQSAI